MQYIYTHAHIKYTQIFKLHKTLWRRHAAQINTHLATSTCPPRAANISGVNPSLVRCSTLAPFANSSFTTCWNASNCKAIRSSQNCVLYYYLQRKLGYRVFLWGICTMYLCCKGVVNVVGTSCDSWRQFLSLCWRIIVIIEGRNSVWSVAVAINIKIKDGTCARM